MGTILLIVVCGAGYIIAYNTYGRFLAKKIFQIRPDAKVPSRELEDGIDYVPTRKGIIFGHHYTSIAGTGPIVGPAIGLIWGWLPAVLWVTIGCIFMGAAHDFGTLVVSMRNEGKSISEIAARYINKRVRLIFFVIVFLTLLIVIAVFGVVIASVFAMFPTSVAPVWVQIPIAVMLGFAVYKKNANVTIATAVAVLCMYVSIWFFSRFDFAMPDMLGMPATGWWTMILLVYAWVASTLPVTTLLQPRDYINAWQLFIAMGLLTAGAVFAALGPGGMELSAPVINRHLPAGTPMLWPTMFVVIACGAISGFHSLVASGTSPKQVASEPDSLFVGYGSMLLEGALAVLIIVCIAGGAGLALKLDDGTTLSGAEAWGHYYSSWQSDKLPVVINGAANMMNAMKIPLAVGATLMGVFIASFAGTTLDTATRIQRYVISELAADMRIKWLTNKYAATTVAAVSAAGLAFANGADGKGAMILWPLFGAANQLLAALALLVITMYLRQKGGMKYLVTAIPCVLMLIITGWAMVINEIGFINALGADKKKWVLVIIGTGMFVLALWMTVETVILFFSGVKTRPQQAQQ